MAGVAVARLGAANQPVVTTDKPEYFSNETVTVTGIGFSANTTLDVPVIRPDGSIVTGDGTSTPGWDTVLSDGSGSFTYFYKLDGISGVYEVRLYLSPWSGSLAEIPLATTTFSDPLIKDFNQCANLTGDCDWVQSILQSSNSIYVENMSVPQRMVFAEIDPISGNLHTLTFSHEATKGGIHAYDWLTSYDQAIA